jgi:hypothetical protein
MGVIMHLGYINPQEPVLTTPEGAGLGVGALLVAGGAIMKGKGGLVMMLVGGLSALVGIGSAAYRAMAKPIGAVPLVAPPKPTAQQTAQQIVQQLAPTVTPLLKNLFSSSPSPAPAPAAAPMVTSYSQLAPTPAPAPSSDFVTSLDDGISGW